MRYSNCVTVTHALHWLSLSITILQRIKQRGNRILRWFTRVLVYMLKLTSILRRCYLPGRGVTLLKRTGVTRKNRYHKDGRWSWILTGGGIMWITTIVPPRGSAPSRSLLAGNRDWTLVDVSTLSTTTHGPLLGSNRLPKMWGFLSKHLETAIHTVAVPFFISWAD